MNRKKQNIITRVIILILSLGSITGGSYLAYRQSVGTPGTAKVTSCKKIRRAETCNGFWTYQGKIQMGEVENTNSDDIGNNVDVRITESYAIKPSLRLPIVLYSIAIIALFLGWRWWKTEAIR
ncbi:hypothetical protein EHQ53_00980 [Leptospira langatensis]|uniref:DUF3592 domain-containing protein n=1 Tax=Leptospira langatensis TaxID=2484983 RepID=A0A5F1ZX42_9LEPT|nr:hypothetical protein [Leptospira langatensis]TGJ98331.1 hypothetical protein EHO57_17125 [Leptospira langatensis]TGL43244.1 hypothetical protein EHQ53_00980 [Leptospira langatensis]